VRAAGDERDLVRPALAELRHLVAPLRRAIEVPDPLARVDERAARRADRVEVVQLAPDGGCRRLVERPHTVVDAAESHERDAGHRARRHLGIEVACAPRRFLRCRRDHERSLRIAFALEQEVSAHELRPRSFRGRSELGDQPIGAFEPAPADGRLVPEVQLGQREADRGSGRRALLARLAVEPVCARERPARRPGLDEPAACVPEPFERACRLRLLERALERELRLAPLASAKRVLSLDQQVHERSVVR
jgi:hypothetical protein